MNLYLTDPEYMERFEYFAFEEVPGEEMSSLDDKTRYLTILASLLGCQGVEEFTEVLPRALKAGVTPVEIKEVVYQATDYLGIGRVRPFLRVTNEVMLENGVKLPLEGQTTTNLENRLQKGSQVQVDIFGEGMRDFWKQSTINRWLAANCFGDYYTRKGLDLAQREMITFCFLMAQGGCEPQLLSHIKGNFNVGNDKEILKKVVLQSVPYIGYPRSLNAMNAINKASEK